MTTTVQFLQEQFRHLRMTEASNELPVLLRNAEKMSWTYQEFLQELLTYELKRREEKNVEKRLKWASFPYYKTLNEFNIKWTFQITMRGLDKNEEAF